MFVHITFLQETKHPSCFMQNRKVWGTEPASPGNYGIKTRNSTKHKYCIATGLPAALHILWKFTQRALCLHLGCVKWWKLHTPLSALTGGNFYHFYASLQQLPVIYRPQGAAQSGGRFTARATGFSPKRQKDITKNICRSITTIKTVYTRDVRKDALAPKIPIRADANTAPSAADLLNRIHGGTSRTVFTFVSISKVTNTQLYNSRSNLPKNATNSCFKPNQAEIIQLDLNY